MVLQVRAVAWKFFGDYLDKALSQFDDITYKQETKNFI